MNICNYIKARWSCFSYCELIPITTTKKTNHRHPNSDLKTVSAGLRAPSSASKLSLPCEFTSVPPSSPRSCHPSVTCWSLVGSCAAGSLCFLFSAVANRKVCETLIVILLNQCVWLFYVASLVLYELWAAVYVLNPTSTILSGRTWAKLKSPSTDQTGFSQRWFPVCVQVFIFFWSLWFYLAIWNNMISSWALLMIGREGSRGQQNSITVLLPGHSNPHHRGK